MGGRLHSGMLFRFLLKPRFRGPRLSHWIFFLIFPIPRFFRSIKQDVGLHPVFKGK